MHQRVTSRIDRSLTHPPQQNTNEHITAPEDALQIDLVPSGGWENILKAIDVLPAIYLRTRHQIRTLKQLLKS